MSDHIERPSYQDLIYEDRLVAFVDILGWSAAVQSSGAAGAGELGWVVVLLQDLEREAQAHAHFASAIPPEVPWPGPTRGTVVTQFSDSVVISLPADDPTAAWTIDQYLSLLCSRACQSGFLVRGGVTRGLIYHRQRIVYGPALIDAYQLEQRAVWPRIVSSPNLFEGTSRGWRIDSADGRTFFDYLTSFHVLPTQYRQLICHGLITATEQRILDKYLWAKNYFSLVIGDDPANGCIAVAIEIDGQLLGVPAGKWP